jgi:glycosyltransferase involved in cell wall biosynthesis
MIQGKTGFAVSTGDIDSFTQAILKLIDNPVLLQEMKQAARNYMDDRSFESAQIQFWNSYN